jgi:transcription initiation factor IIE alpha subunit
MEPLFTELGWTINYRNVQDKIKTMAERVRDQIKNEIQGKMI